MDALYFIECIVKYELAADEIKLLLGGLKFVAKKFLV
jgi:hypothetical protein